MTEILLLGTFHFMESAIDFYSLEAQKELQIISEKLIKFTPDAIAVEAASHAQKYIDISYDKFDLKDLNDFDKMKSETLGEIYIFGGFYPMTYNNEVIQIGYRLGKMLSLPKIYAIDDDVRLDMSPMKSVEPSLSEAKSELKMHLKNEPKKSIINMFRYYNDNEFTELNHNTYIQANSVNADSDYSGAKMVASWYERNLKIFANIQRLATKNKRILVVYGAGHLKLLKQFIDSDKNLKLISIDEYL